MLNEARRGNKRRALAGTHPERVVLSLLDQATSRKVIRDDKNVYVDKKCGIELCQKFGIPLLNKI